MKEKKKKKKLTLKERKPTDMEETLWCNGCQAIAREILKKIYNSKKESDVIIYYIL